MIYVDIHINHTYITMAYLSIYLHIIYDIQCHLLTSLRVTGRYFSTQGKRPGCWSDGGGGGIEEEAPDDEDEAAIVYVY